MIDAKVNYFNDCPTLFINGQPVNGIMHWNRWPEAVDVANFHEAGVNILSFMGNIWLGEEHDRKISNTDTNTFNDGRMSCPTFDHRNIDEYMKKLLGGNPDLMIMPRIRLVPPDWWKEIHPDEMMIHYRLDSRDYKVGNWPAITSTIWLESATKALVETVEYFEQVWGDRIIGYHSGFGDCIEHSYQWGFPDRVISDYSKPQTLAFQRWVKDKYDDIKALREAWKISDIEFYGIQVPSPEKRICDERQRCSLYNPEVDMWAIDYQRFNSESMANAVLSEASTVKNTLHSLGRNKIFGAFYAYHNLPANEPQSHYNTGHDAHDPVLESEDIDFICAPIGYSARQPGGMVGLVTEDDDANMACKGGSDLQRPRIADIKPRQSAVIENLPHIDGITYQQNKAQDGALYITATGNTRNKNGILKEAGFKWNSSRKLWWKAA